jgi:hypothetical protein
MIDRSSIFSSFYKEEFENVNSDNIYLLSKQNSASIWSQRIDKEANTYFYLPDNNWLVVAGYTNIGEWEKSFNSEEPKMVRDLLSKSVDWSNDEVVFFCINRDTVIETCWEVFTSYWINFLYCESDCPIIMTESNRREAFIFRAIGDFLLVRG